ncbi:MAG TPA: ergothioneine biosynthesis protein EgtB [Rhodocyclaceae bacterium]|nr:ergothioneine biosynthesis protein EgtB [Rhodocyclaceae bacterium]
MKHLRTHTEAIAPERLDPDDPHKGWPHAYRRIRGDSEALCLPLRVEDYVIQTVAEASPAKWHLAHVSWFFETFILREYLPGYAEFDPAYRTLFNSYYEEVGAFHPRDARGFLSRPTVEEVYRYRAHVDEHMLALLGERRDRPWPEILERVVIGLNHEQQHQELLLTDLKRNLAANPLRPAYRTDLAAPPAGARAALGWREFHAGVCQIGHAGDAFAYDNERPRHRVYLEPFRLASRPVTNGEYLVFMESGGYANPALWLADGWAQVRAAGWASPLYWERIGGEWWHFTLAGMRRLNPEEPVCHVSYYEADAYAAWAGRRLPTEAEWEVAAAGMPVAGNLRERGLLASAIGAAGSAGTPAATAAAPRAGGDDGGDGAADDDGTPAGSGAALEQLYGDVWEHTASAYLPYPGFRVAPGALGEYNGKFMCNQMVLRGGSCVTPADHLRATYRNFFYPHERWQFQGLRLAEDAA